MSRKEPLSIAAITGGRAVPSRRFRVAQLVPALKENEIHIHEFLPRVSTYPPASKWIRPLWGAAALAERLPYVLATYRYDGVLFQREIISTLVTLEHFCHQPRIFDVDDAIFLHGSGHAARRIAHLSDCVICGNQFLAEHFSEWNKHVTVVPTAVDTERFAPVTSTDIRATGQCSIGWIGTGGNLKYVLDIEPALAAILRRFPLTELHIISDKLPAFERIPADRIKFIPWSPDREVTALQRLSIGIMPLRDTPWERGKCSYKMLQYMACNSSVVVSPVGMNQEILDSARVGFPARTIDEWINALEYLIQHPQERKILGSNGRALIMERFSISAVAAKLCSVIQEVVSG